MSEWDGPNTDEAATAQAGNVVPIRGRRHNNNRTVTPYVSMSNNMPAFDDGISSLRANNGQTRAGLARLLDPEAGDIEAVSVVRRLDNSPAFIEIRTSYKASSKKHGKKTFRLIYRGDVIGSDDARHDGNAKLCSEIEPLAKAGLLIPSNANALIEAVEIYKSDIAKNNRPAFFWCEGEKSRLGLQRRINDTMPLFEASGVQPVTAATLSGMTGVRLTNYLIAANAPYRMTGKNDVVLDLECALHYIVMDNDTAGFHEAQVLAERFNIEYGVPDAQIFLVDAPLRAVSGWDDADPLPIGMSDDDRTTQILSSPPFFERWVYKYVKERAEINSEHIGNRRRALKLAGITECYMDTSVNRAVIKGEWGNKESPDDAELLKLAEHALGHMKHQPLMNNLNASKWRETLDSLVIEQKRDLIYEETLGIIEKGRATQSDANTPDRLFIEMFGLPDTRFNRLAGSHLIRDMLALRLRSAFNTEPVIPQLLYVFYGSEGCGKSTAIKVLAGGSPAPINDAPRYSDSLDLYDLRGSDTHGDLQLYHKIAGKVAVELADKSLGTDINRSRADMLKHFANKGSVLYRGMWVASPKTCNLRCIRIFTTNNSDILTSDMGSRRWVIIDTTKTEWIDHAALQKQLLADKRDPTPHEAARLIKHNPGLNWLHENLAAMFAHMHDSGEWRHDLHPNIEFATLLADSQSDYVSEENWEIIFNDMLKQFEHADVGIQPTQFAHYFNDMFGRIVKPNAYNVVLRRRNWQSNSKRNDDGHVVRLWHFGRHAKDVKRYATWVHRDGATPGRWTLQTSVKLDDADRMQAAASDMPF